MKLAVANLASKFNVMYVTLMSDGRSQEYLTLPAPKGSQYMAKSHATIWDVINKINEFLL